MSVWTVASGVLALVAAVMVPVMGFLIRGWLQSASDTWEARETRFTEANNSLRTKIAEVDKSATQNALETSRQLEKLPDRYVPRKELEAIIQRIEAGRETNLSYLKNVDRQVDNLTTLILKDLGIKKDKEK